MKIRYILLLVISFFVINVNASSIKYDLTISDDLTFNEKIEYNISNSEMQSNKYSFLKSVVNDNIYFNEDSDIYYTKTKTNTSDGHLITLTHKYPSMFLNGSRIVKECFNIIDYNNNPPNISFSSRTPFYCSKRADTITINITTNLNVNSHNADKVDNNTYTWNNIDNKFTLKMSIKQKSKQGEEGPTDGIGNYHSHIDDNTENNEVKKSSKILLYITIGAFVFLLIAVPIIYIFLKKQSEKLNKI